jgi:thiamine pyrophosphate-dependent acetolactate synthase large subunit-like protein
MLSAAERPVVIVGNGARSCRARIVEFADRFDLPVITTFKAKGMISDDHPLGCGVLGRSGTPVGSSMMARSDCLLVLGASFSNHTGISKKKPTIQVDFDRMILGKFHSVDVPLWGDIERTVELLSDRLGERRAPEIRDEIAGRKALWRAEKRRRAEMRDQKGAMHPARLFETLGKLAPEDAVLPVDVGNNTYAFGHYFECKANQDVLMSGYLGSIGFALPAALGAWAAAGGSRKVLSIGGDGGLGQYLADFTTAVKYEMPITHIVMNNDELAKISREQVGALRPVWQTSLVNPDFAAFADLCGGRGFRVDEPEELEDALRTALAVDTIPTLVEVRTSPRWV